MLPHRPDHDCPTTRHARPARSLVASLTAGVLFVVVLLAAVMAPARTLLILVSVTTMAAWASASRGDVTDATNRSTADHDRVES